MRSTAMTKKHSSALYLPEQDEPLYRTKQRRQFLVRFCERLHAGGVLDSDHYLVSGSDVNTIALIAKLQPELDGEARFLRERTYYSIQHITNFEELLRHATYFVRLGEILYEQKPCE